MCLFAVSRGQYILHTIRTISHQGIDHHVHQGGEEASLSSELLVGITDCTTQDPPQHVAKHDGNKQVLDASCRTLPLQLCCSSENISRLKSQCAVSPSSCVVRPTAV